MPMPIGGAIALSVTGSGSARRGSLVEERIDPELERFKLQQRHIRDNLKCTIQFEKSVIPPKGGIIGGVLVLEADEDIEHSGLFILMKGLPVVYKRRQKTPKAHVRFMVLGSTYTEGGGNGREDGGEYMLIEGNSRETYPLELNIPLELPSPIITSQGRLVYRMQLYASTIEGKPVGVGETTLRWQGCRVLTREEIEKSIQLEQLVEGKREYFGLLGKKKSVQIKWRVNRGGYLPGEVMHVELLGETKESGGMEVECRLELVQKVWYQVPSTTGSGQMWVKMKVNAIATAESEEVLEVSGGEEKIVVWTSSLKVPKGITPTYRNDFTNSVSYSIRARVGIAGEPRESWVTGEVPLLIGSSKEIVEGEEEEQEADDEDDEDIDLQAASTPQSRASPVPPEMLQKRRASEVGGVPHRRSQSMGFIAGWMRPRAGSVSSVGSCQSFASSTLSIFRMPPSYSQLSSRRPTQETLPPAYCELELQEQGGSGSPAPEEDGGSPGPSSLPVAVEDESKSEIAQEEKQLE